MARAVAVASALLGIVAITTAITTAGETKMVRFHATARGGDLPSSVRLQLRSVADAAVVREVVLQSGQAETSLVGAEEWELSVTTPGWWLLPRRIATAPDEQAVDFDLWPAGEVTGVVAPASAGGATPSEIALAVERMSGRPSDAGEIPQGTRFTCPVDAQGRWTCVLPATTVDLVLRAPAMTPHYRWDVAVADGRRTDLGTFRLRPGASFVAYLDGDTVRLLTKPARARLFRPVGAVASETAARLALPVAEAEFTSRGWVQLAPLPPGSYVLEVSAEGFAPAQIGSIEIYEGKESSFRKAVALFPPLRVSVTVRPPVDLGEKPWRVTWNRVGDFTPETASIIAYTNREGVATIENQSPGAFHVQVDDVNRNSVHSSDVRVDGPETAVVPIRLDLLVVKGQVVQGEEPLAAELRFGGSDGAIGTYVRTDEEGAFETRLPRLGRWPVEVRNDRGVGTLLQVDVERDEDLLLRIPDTSVAGWVVSESGERVKRGSVTVLVAGRGLGTTLDDRGEFRMKGLPAGVVQIVGRDRTTGDSSEFVRLDLREGQPRENVELRIERSRRITGTVSSAGQPVVGAQISAAALDTSAITKEAVTDLSGRFNLLLPVRVRRAHFTVSAPSRTLQTFDLPLSDQPIVLDVAASGGTLIIRSAPGATTPYRVRRNGVSVHLPSLLSWVSAHGHPLTDVENLPVPNLAPGHYEVCAAARCVDGTLTPGGTLQLDVSR